MVAMLMGHKDIVGLGHCRKIYHSVPQLGHRVNLNLLAIILHTDAGMNEGMELHRLSTLGLEHINLIAISRHNLSCLFPGEDATFQVHALITFSSQFACSIS